MFQSWVSLIGVINVVSGCFHGALGNVIEVFSVAIDSSERIARIMHINGNTHEDTTAAIYGF